MASPNHINLFILMSTRIVHLCYSNQCEGTNNGEACWFVDKEGCNKNGTSIISRSQTINGKHCDKWPHSNDANATCQFIAEENKIPTCWDGDKEMQCFHDCSKILTTPNIAAKFKSADEDDTLNIILIIGSVFVGIVLMFMVYCFCIRKKKRKRGAFGENCSDYETETIDANFFNKPKNFQCDPIENVVPKTRSPKPSMEMLGLPVGSEIPTERKKSCSPIHFDMFSTTTDVASITLDGFSKPRSPDSFSMVTAQGEEI